MQFSTYLGGAMEDWIRDVVTDSQGNIYVAGGTSSSNFSTTAGAYNRVYGTPGSSCTSLGGNGPMDVLVAKFTATEQLVWSTYLGGPCYDRAYGIEIEEDAQGNVQSVVVGGRAGEGFPTGQFFPTVDPTGVVQASFGGYIDQLGAYGKQDGFIAGRRLRQGDEETWIS